jgi:hypothetical protein
MNARRGWADNIKMDLKKAMRKKESGTGSEQCPTARCGTTSCNIPQDSHLQIKYYFCVLIQFAEYLLKFSSPRFFSEKLKEL